MENKNIFTIQFELEEIEKQIEANEGEITAKEFEIYEITKDELKSKIEKYLYVIKDLELNNSEVVGRINYHKEEIKRLEAIKKPRENKIIRMKDVISSALKFFSVETLEYSEFKLSFRKSKSVVVMNESELPKVAFESKLKSKTDLKKLIEDGTITTGAEIKTNSNLQIK